MPSEEVMKFDPKKRFAIYLVSAVVIWVVSFFVWYSIFNYMDTASGIVSGIRPFLFNFSVILATLVCFEAWFFGAFELIEKYIAKRNLKRHLDEMDKR
ncbi:MAG: hypothetical protein KAI64_01320 [Thermoplasmata archaeon]|nr:hypothetical protein [Thermoplasmata archaeon]